MQLMPMCSKLECLLLANHLHLSLIFVGQAVQLICLSLLSVPLPLLSLYLSLSLSVLLYLLLHQMFYYPYF
jgi:hypothetical protein